MRISSNWRFRNYPPTLDTSKMTSSNAGDDENEEEGSIQKHQKEYRPKIAGAFVMCPLVEGESRQMRHGITGFVES